jgi:hypothetical protein
MYHPEGETLHMESARRGSLPCPTDGWSGLFFVVEQGLVPPTGCGHQTCPPMWLNGPWEVWRPLGGLTAPGWELHLSQQKERRPFYVKGSTW